MINLFMKSSGCQISTKLWRPFLVLATILNFQPDNFHHNSEYNDFTYISKNHWMSEYLVIQLYIQAFR